MRSLLPWCSALLLLACTSPTEPDGIDQLAGTTWQRTDRQGYTRTLSLDSPSYRILVESELGPVGTFKGSYEIIERGPREFYFTGTLHVIYTNATATTDTVLTAYEERMVVQPQALRIGNQSWRKVQTRTLR